MGSAVVHELEIQPVELFQVREVLRCVVHTILFNRALGLVRPKSVESQLFDSISYVQCGDPSVEKEIDEKIEQLCALVEKCPTFSHLSTSSHSAAPLDASLTKAQLVLSFFERRQVKRSSSSSGMSSVTSWFGVGSTSGMLNPEAAGSTQGDKQPNSASSRGCCWEQWHISLSVFPQMQSRHHRHHHHQQQQHKQQQQQSTAQRALSALGRSVSSSESSSDGAAAVDSSFESGERVRRSAKLEAELRETLLMVLVRANQNRQNIPPVWTSDIIPFPYEIIIPSLSESTFGMDLLKRMLQATPPSLLS